MSAAAPASIDPRLQRLESVDGRIVFFPVRHHSPTAARLVREFILSKKPAAVLIEGPSDYNSSLDQLYLKHTLPIAIYSYVHLEEEQRRGAFYPFCEYSPEWQALLAAKKVRAKTEFIDLPWSELAVREKIANRYADAELRRSSYVKRLCCELGVDDFDGLWDELFEIEPLTLQQYMSRCHHYCCTSRILDGEHVSDSDHQREAFMAKQIRRVGDELNNGTILVVTGGYHSLGLLDRLEGRTPPSAEPADAPDKPAFKDRGISLTPYSYERLDSLTGYESGMPGPGFYEHVWRDRNAGERFRHQNILQLVVKALRKHGQTVSSADLIGVESTAQALAMLREHGDVWRRDLLDGLKSAVLKDEVALGCSHPMLDAILEVFRGSARGKLASGTALPPLVADLQAQLAAHGLEPRNESSEVKLDLDKPVDAEKSAVLHRLRLLKIAGFSRTDGTDLTARNDLTEIWELWRIMWSPEFDSSCIEAARYGSSLGDSATAVLVERMQAVQRSSGDAAELLLDAGLSHLSSQAAKLYARVDELIRSESDFFSSVRALRHLLYLYKYDRVLRTAGLPLLEDVIHPCWERALGLLESLGQVSGKDAPILKAVATLVETFEACNRLEDAKHDYSRDEFIQILTRIAADSGQSPAVRGAASGALWVLGGADSQKVLSEMKLFADPAHLGDYLSGVFCLAREPAQREEGLLRAVDELVSGYNDDQYLIALPALRLAFTYFTPREKHHLALNLLKMWGVKSAADIPSNSLKIDPALAAQAIAFEARLFSAVEKFGLRGGTKEGGSA